MFKVIGYAFKGSYLARVCVLVGRGGGGGGRGGVGEGREVGMERGGVI